MNRLIWFFLLTLPLVAKWAGQVASVAVLTGKSLAREASTTSKTTGAPAHWPASEVPLFHPSFHRL